MTIYLFLFRTPAKGKPGAGKEPKAEETPPEEPEEEPIPTKPKYALFAFRMLLSNSSLVGLR